MRPPSSVWRHFTSEKLGNKKKVICRYCQKQYTFPNATKMARHLNRCVKKPFTVQLEDTPNEGEPADLFDLPILEIDTSSSTLSSVSVYNSAATPNTAVHYVPETRTNMKSNQTTLRTFMDTMTVPEIDKLDTAFARAIYASNCPLSLTDNQYWKEFLHLIRPSYRIPTRNDLTNTLLENEYMRVMQAQKEKIDKSEYVSIVTDGWSNIRNEGIISNVVTTPCPVFYKSIETNHNRHTGEYIAQELSSVINEVNRENVLAVVTDNASNMKAAWKIIKNSFPCMFTIGCAAHGINLLLSDIAKISTFSTIITRSKDIIKYVKHKQALLSIFTSKQKLKKGTAASSLKLLADTRWSAVLIMFESLINGKESLQEAILQEDLNIDREIRQLVLDNDLFWASVTSLAKVLQPICHGISLVESDKAHLSDVRNVFHDIGKSFSVLVSTPLQTAEEEMFINSVSERQAMCCQPIHLAAYLLGPRYQGKELIPEEYQEAINFIANFPSQEEESAKIIANLAEYRAHTGIFSSEALWSSAEYVNPLTWWKGGLLNNQSLSNIAIKLFNIPPSSAACERIFSAFSKTHTVLRNRLNNDRVSKLIAIRSSLIMDSKIPDLYSEFME